MTPPETCPHCGAAKINGCSSEYWVRYSCLTWVDNSGEEQSTTCLRDQVRKQKERIERLTAALEKITKLSFKENQEWIPQSIAREALNPDKTPGGAK